MLGATLLAVASCLPAATCPSEMDGEVSEATIRYLTPQSLLDPSQIPEIAAFFWPLVAISALFLVASPLMRRLLRVVEACLLAYSTFFLFAPLAVGRPALGFFLGITGIASYTAGCVLGVPISPFATPLERTRSAA